MRSIQCHRCTPILFIVTLVGCSESGGPAAENALSERIAGAACTVLSACGCGHTEATQASCRSRMDETVIDFGSEIAAIKDRHLTYDHECADARITWLEACGRLPEPDPCNIYHGDLPLDAPCEGVEAEIHPALFAASECARGLTCINGNCVSQTQDDTSIDDDDSCVKEPGIGEQEICSTLSPDLCGCYLSCMVPFSSVSGTALCLPAACKAFP